MACTLSNRETFAVMQWLEADNLRRARIRERAHELMRVGIEHAIPKMSNYIFLELQQELPDLDGIMAELLKGGLRKVNFLELAHAVLTGVDEFIAPAVPAAANDSQ
jgi:hypothetical protein